MNATDRHGAAKSELAARRAALEEHNEAVEQKRAALAEAESAASDASDPEAVRAAVQSARALRAALEEDSDVAAALERNIEAAVDDVYRALIDVETEEAHDIAGKAEAHAENFWAAWDSLLEAFESLQGCQAIAQSCNGAVSSCRRRLGIAAGQPSPVHQYLVDFHTGLTTYHQANHFKPLRAALEQKARQLRGS